MRQESFSGVKRWRVRRRRWDEASLLRLRLVVFRGLALFLFLILAGQLWRLQIVEGSRYQLRAEANRLRILPLSPLRGVIYDRAGRLLAENLPTFTAGIVPADLPREHQIALSQQIAPLLDMPAEEVQRRVEERRAQRYLFSPVAIRRDLTQETAFKLHERQDEFPGVTVLVEPKRSYPAGPWTSHLLGYVGWISSQEYKSLQQKGYSLNDRVGKTGLELAYEEVLRGRPGIEQVEVDAYGKKLRTLQSQPAQPGDNLVLALDLKLQQAVAQILQEGMGQSQQGVAAVMNPKTGEVLALVSLPTYDNNRLSASLTAQELAALLEDPGRPLLNHAVAGSYPPGSIFKAVTGTAALQEGIATPQTRIVSRGQIQVSNQYNPAIVYTFYDWAPLGSLDFVSAVALSSDVYYYYLAGGYQEFRGLGADRLSRYAREFGLGEPTGIDVPGEVPGLVPDPTWKERALGEQWLTGDTYNFGIGQGFLSVTPLQMLRLTGALANGGSLMQPRIVREVVDREGRVLHPFTPRVVRRVPIASQHLNLFREGMRQAVAWGTATLAQVPGIAVAGKTGTAEFGQPVGEGREHQTHGWFIGFAPFDDPEVAVVVFLEQGRGAQNAAPIAGRILRAYFGVAEVPAPSAGG